MQYVDRKILPENPFQVLDVAGMGQLMRMGVEKGRSTKKNLKIGICGEHGGDPQSIAFCHEVGLDYVSCSPFRVPVARLAAAQAGHRRAGDPRQVTLMAPSLRSGSSSVRCSQDARIREVDERVAVVVDPSEHAASATPSVSAQVGVGGGTTMVGDGVGGGGTIGVAVGAERRRRGSRRRRRRPVVCRAACGVGVLCGSTCGAGVATATADGSARRLLGLSAVTGGRRGLLAVRLRLRQADGTPASTPSAGDAVSCAEPSCVGRSSPEAPMATLAPRSTTATAPTA